MYLLDPDGVSLNLSPEALTEIENRLCGQGSSVWKFAQLPCYV